MRLFAFILLLSWLLLLWAPWWIIMAVSFAFCLWLGKSAGHAFLASFLAIFLLWLGASSISHIQTGSILSERVSELFKLPSPALLILLTALTGGLAAGCAGWAGFECRRLLRRA